MMFGRKDDRADVEGFCGIAMVLQVLTLMVSSSMTTSIHGAARRGDYQSLQCKQLDQCKDTVGHMRKWSTPWL